MQSNTLIHGSLMLAVVILFVFVLIQSADRSARSECLKWADMAKEYKGFYLTPAEAEQCSYYHIEINAPVLKAYE